MFSHFKETLSGLETIRAYGIEERFRKEHHALLDASVCARLNWDFANRWMGIRLDIIGAAIVSASALLVAFSTLSSSSGGNAGIMLSYALKATQSLSFAIRSSAALENMFTSPERVFEYIKIEQEANANAFDGRLSPLLEKSSIAEVGPVLVAEGIVARYSRDLPPALKGVSFSIRSGRLIGICGRTGVRDQLKKTKYFFLTHTHTHTHNKT